MSSLNALKNAKDDLPQQCFVNKLSTFSQNNCGAAYSLRLLISSYTGPMIQIRRTSDNITINFFGDIQGNLGTQIYGQGQSYISWLNGSTGFVVTWYDQSGNSRNVSQTTQANQPQLLTNGNILYNTSSQTALYMTASANLLCPVNAGNKTLTLIGNWLVTNSPTTQLVIYSQGSNSTNNNYAGIFCNVSSSNGQYGYWGYGNDINVVTFSSNVQRKTVMMCNHNNSTGNIVVNDNGTIYQGTIPSPNSMNIINTTGTVFSIGGYTTTSNYFLSGYINEVIIFNNTLTTKESELYFVPPLVTKNHYFSQPRLQIKGIPKNVNPLPITLPKIAIDSQMLSYLSNGTITNIPTGASGSNFAITSINTFATGQSVILTNTNSTPSIDGTYTIISATSTTFTITYTKTVTIIGILGNWKCNTTNITTSNFPSTYFPFSGYTPFQNGSSSWPIYNTPTTSTVSFINPGYINFNGTTGSTVGPYINMSSSLILNVGTNNGFTAICYVQFTDNATQSEERIFDLGNGNRSDNISLSRSTTTNQLRFLIYNGSSNIINAVGGTIVQNQWMLIVCRYTYASSDGLAELIINGIQVSVIENGVAQVANRTTINNYLGKSNTTNNDGALQGNIAGLYIYDVSLTDIQVNTISNHIMYSTNASLPITIPDSTRIQVVGSVLNQGSRTDNAMFFNGSSLSYVDFQDIPNTPVSISLWFYGTLTTNFSITGTITSIPTGTSGSNYAITSSNNLLAGQIIVISGTNSVPYIDSTFTIISATTTTFTITYNRTIATVGTSGNWYLQNNYPNVIASFGDYARNGNGVNIVLTNPTTINFVASLPSLNSNTVSSTNVIPNAWNHIYIGIMQYTIWAYLNGTYLGAATGSNIPPSCNRLILGADNGSYTAIVTGSITSYILTVTAVTSGIIYTGMQITGTNVTSGTYITSFNSGYGGLGTYNLNKISSAGSTTITGTGLGFNGYISDCRIFDYLLVDTGTYAGTYLEVQQLYNGNDKKLLVYPQNNNYLVTAESGTSCYWWNIMSVYSVGIYKTYSTGSDPIVYATICANKISNNYWYNKTTIQNYKSFSCSFEFQITSGTGDFISFFCGANQFAPLVGTPLNSFMLVFQVYSSPNYLSAPYNTQGIYLINNNGIVVANYPLINWITSGQYTPVTISYIKGTIGTWIINLNGLDIITYSDSGNTNWLTTAGPYWGICGACINATMTANIRKLELSYSNSSSSLNNTVNSLEVAKIPPAQMTGNTMNIPGISWLNGTYTASASSGTPLPFCAFQNNAYFNNTIANTTNPFYTSTNYSPWECNISLYISGGSTTGIYSSTTSTNITGLIYNTITAISVTTTTITITANNTLQIGTPTGINIINSNCIPVLSGYYPITGTPTLTSFQINAPISTSNSWSTSGILLTLTNVNSNTFYIGMIITGTGISGSPVITGFTSGSGGSGSIAILNITQPTLTSSSTLTGTLTINQAGTTGSFTPVNIYSITGTSGTAPGVITLTTATAVTFITGQQVTITGNANLNGTYYIFVASSTTFTILYTNSFSGSQTGAMVTGNSNSYGEYLQLVIPNPIAINSFAIFPSQYSSFYLTKSPRYFVLAGSWNGTIWYAIHVGTGITNWTPQEKTFICNQNNTNKYSYFRLIVQVIGNTACDINAPISISNLSLYTQTSMNNNKGIALPGLFSSNTLTVSGNVNPLYNGSFIVSASSTFNLAPQNTYGAVNIFPLVYNGGNVWNSQNSTVYNSSFPFAYNTTTYQTTVSGTVYSGEWFQIQVPKAITVTSFLLASQINNSGLVYFRRGPSLFVLAGSNDTSTWSAIHILQGNTNFVNWGMDAIIFNCNVGNLNSYLYFRLIITNTGGGDGFLGISYINLYTNSVQSRELLDGFTWKYITAYHNGDATFSDRVYYSNIGRTLYTGSLLANTSGTYPNDTQINFSIEQFGYFVPQTTGPHIFYCWYSDDVSYMWFGNKAYGNRVTTNADWTSNYGSPQTYSQCVYHLLKGVYYPIRTLYGQNGGTSNWGHTWGYCGVYATNCSISGTVMTVSGTSATASSWTITNGTTLTLTTVTAGTFVNGMVLSSSANITGSPVINGFTSGSGGSGSIATISVSQTNGTFSTVLTGSLGQVGLFTVGMQLIGLNVPYFVSISSFGTGTGGIGTYNLSASATISGPQYIYGVTYGIGNDWTGYIYTSLGVNGAFPAESAKVIKDLTGTNQDGTYNIICYPGSQASSTAGSISGSVFTAGGSSSGFTVGQLITGTSGSITPNTYITSLGTGTGGNGTYNLSQSSTVTSIQIYGVGITTGQTFSTPTYCLMNDHYDGGGWMMLMKSTIGSTFSYNSNYWTSNNVLNNTDITRNNADAKFNTFNYTSLKDIMAIWPDISPTAYTNSYGNNGGSIYTQDGWVWLLNNWYNTNSNNVYFKSPALLGFQNSRAAAGYTPSSLFQTTGMNNPIRYSGYASTLIAGSTQSNIHYINGSNTALSTPSQQFRWGLIYNTSTTSYSSASTYHAIGTSNSAGDSTTTSRRMEMYGR